MDWLAPFCRTLRPYEYLKVMRPGFSKFQICCNYNMPISQFFHLENCVPFPQSFAF